MRSAAGAATASINEPGAGLRWEWRRFDALGVDALYDLLALRARVFLVEQGPYLDLDGADRSAWHLLGRNADAELAAYLRVVDPGVKFDEPSIGRVVVAPTLRGCGVGHALMRAGLARCDVVWPGRSNRISAQAHLQRFYAAHGYATVTPEYLEDQIPHVQMLRSPR